MRRTGRNQVVFRLRECLRIVVPDHAERIQGHQEIKALGGMRTITDHVTDEDDFVHCSRSFKNRPESGKGCMDVGKEQTTHDHASAGGRGDRAASVIAVHPPSCHRERRRRGRRQGSGPF